MEKWRVLQIWKYVGLFIGCIAKFTSGSIFVFNAYQNAIKSTFNYTQSEVELLSSSLNLGLGTGFLPGMLFDRFGPFWTSGAGLIISGGAYLLIWSCTKYVDYYKSRSGLMALFFYLAGFGSLFSYMSALNTNVINFHAKHRGKIIGILNAFFTGSPSVFALLYYHAFSTGDYNVIKNQDYAGFMLFVAILFISVNILCMLFLHNLSPWMTEDKTINVLSDSNAIEENGKLQNTINEIQGERTSIIERSTVQSSAWLRFVSLMKNGNFYLLASSFTLASILSVVNTNNITVITRSVGLSSYDNALLVSMPVMNTILSLSIGPLSDKFQEMLPRQTFFVMSCVCFTVAELIFLFFLTSIEGIFFGVFMLGIAIGTLWTIVPTIISELFGIEDFGRNWGILLVNSGLAALAGQAIFGKLYDDNVTIPGEHYCYGRKCFTVDLIIMTIFGVISIALAGILEIRSAKRTQNQPM